MTNYAVREVKVNKNLDELKAEVERLKVKNEKYTLTNEILIDEYGKLSDRLTEREAKWRELETISDTPWNAKTGIERRNILARIEQLRSELMEVKDEVS